MAKTIKTGLIITGDAKGGVSALKLTDDQLKGLNATQKKAVQQNKASSASFDDLSKKVASYGTASAVAAAVGVGVMVNQQLAVIDSTAKVSDKLGISTEALAAMHLQAERSGVATNTMNMALQRMVRRLSEAAQGTGEAQGALKELNLGAVELAKLSPDKQFAAIAEKMKDVNNQGDKVRLAFKLFDSEGVSLINTLNGGAAAAKDAQDFVAKYGVAISRLDAAKIEAVNDKWGDANKAIDGLVNTLTISLSKALSDAADDLRDFVGSISEVVNGPSISQLEAEIASLESRIAGSAGGRRSARHGDGGLPEKLAATRKELLYLKADSGDVQAITQVISELGTVIDDLEGQGSGRGRNKAGYASRLSGVIQLHEHYQSALKETAEEAVAANSVTEAQTEKLRALTKAELQLVDALLPVQAKQQKIKTQLAEIKTAYQETTLGTEKYTQAKSALEKQLHDLNNPMESILSNLQIETQWLKKELAATTAGEQALQSFNRTKTIELDLRRLNAEQLAPAEVARLRAEIAARYDAAKALDDYQAATETAGLAQIKTIAAVESATTKATNVYVTAWQRAIERVDETFADAWAGAFDGFKSFSDSILDSFKRLLAEMAHLAITKPIIIGLGMGGSGVASASGGAGLLGSGSGGGFSVTELLSAGKSLLSGGLTGAHLGAAGGVDYIANLLYENGFGNAASGLLESSAGFAAQGGGNLALGGLYTAGAGIAGGYLGTQFGSGLFGKDANSNLGATAGAGVGAIAGSILPGFGTAFGAAAGGAIGGLLDAAFGGDGKKRVALGVRTDPNIPVSGTGQLQGASGLIYTGYQKRAGQAGADATTALVQEFAALDTSLTNLYGLFGNDINLAGQSLTGKAHQAGKTGGDFFGSAAFNSIDPAQLETTADSFLTAWNSAIADQVDSVIDLDLLKDLQGEGEALASTISRVQIEFVAVTGALDALGFELIDLSVGGLAAADGLVQAFGGLDQLSTGITAYYDAFYTDGEKLEKLGASLTQQFSALGVAMPKTRDGFRDIVDGLDLASAASQRLFADLINLAPALDQYIAGQAQATTANVGQSLADLSTDILGRYDAEQAAIQEAADARMSALRAETQEIERIAQSLLGTVDKLKLSSLSPLSNQARLDFAQNQYQQALAAAQGGDLTAASNLGAIGENYLSEAAQFYASSSNYTDIFNDVTGALGAMGTEFANDADISAELAQIQTKTLSATLGLGATALKQLQQMVGMTNGIDSVAELLAVLPSQLSTKLSTATGVTAANLSTDPIYELYTRGLDRRPDADGYAYWQNQLDSGTSLSQIKAAFFNAAQINGEETINQFATGTPFVSHDQIAGIHQGEMIIDRQSSDALRKYGINVGTSNNNALLAELKALRGEVVTLRTDVASLRTDVASLRSERARDADHARTQRTQQRESIERSGRQAARSKVKVLS